MAQSNISFLSIDSSLSNTGVAYGTIDTDGNIDVTSLHLVETKKSKNKKIRVSSDTIARCRQTWEFVQGLIEEYNPAVVFAETPSGSQSANGMKSYGATCQLLGMINPPPIEVTPIEVKAWNFNGRKNVSKKEIIAWAYGLYPNVEGWNKNKDGSLKNKNEHIADAIAIAHAGIQTPYFRGLANLVHNHNL